MATYTIQQLECFFSIVDSGSMSKASETLFLTQPSLSKTLKRLEEGLGFELFEREANRMHLTPEGEFFYMRAKPLYQNLSALIYTVQNMSKGWNMLRVGIYSGHKSEVLRETVKQFRELNPEIDVLVNVMNRRSLREGLSMGKLDVIFSMSYAVKRIEDSKSKTIEATDFYLVVNKNTKMADENQVDFEYINAHPLYLCSTIETQTLEQNDQKRCREIGIVPKKNVYLETQESCFNAVASGGGICFSSCEELPAGLQAVKVPWVRNKPEYVAVWLEHNTNAALHSFLDMFPNI